LCLLQQEEWEAQLEILKRELQRDVIELSRRRREAAGRMGSGVESCLKDLSMSRSHFDVCITWREAKEVRDAGSLGSTLYEEERGSPGE